MKLPWVSRLAFETLDRERGYLTHRVETAEDRNMVLLNEILTMRVEGFSQPQPEAPVAPEPMALPEVIMDGLDQLGLAGAAKAQMETWAWRQLGRDRDPAVIASELVAGGLREEAR